MKERRQRTFYGEAPLLLPANKDMQVKCPHPKCGGSYRIEWKFHTIKGDQGIYWVRHTACDLCNKFADEDVKESTQDEGWVDIG